MKITGILFDKDDTLINLADFWRTPIRRTCCCLARRLAGRENLQLTEQLCRAAGFQDGRLLEESLVVAGTNRDIVEAWKRVAQEHGFCWTKNWPKAPLVFWSGPASRTVL